MNHKIVPVSQLNEDQIKKLAQLHHKVMHSLLTDLGLPIVEHYYQIVCKDSGVVGFCALSETGQLLGWAIGSSKPDQLNGRLREAPLWFISQMVRVLFTHPRVMGQLLSSMRTASISIPEGTLELTYIGVDTSIRKQGVGHILLDTFTQAARELNYRAVVLSVEVENANAIALYTKADFKVAYSFSEGQFKRHRMELTL